MGSWADIHSDILQAIAEKFTHHMDFLCFAAVCKPWRSFAMDNLHRLPHELPLRYCLPLQNPVPLLMHFSYDEAEDSLDFFSIVDRKYVSRFFLPEINQKEIAGPSNGWLFMIDMNYQEINLLNPFTGALIPLPSLSTFQQPESDDFIDYEDFWYIQKAVISSNPNRSSGGDCIVIAIRSLKTALSFCRPGDDKWTNLGGSIADLSDVIPYKGQFCAITEMGTTIVCDAAGDRNVKEIVEGVLECRKRHLVESPSGDLLHIARIFEDVDYGSFSLDFNLYRLEVVDEPNIEVMREFDCNLTIDGAIVPQRELGFRWVKLESLGDQVVFLGPNCSLCLPSQSVPGCKRNCIFFTDDVDDYGAMSGDAKEGDNDGLFQYGVNVYDMENRSIERFGEMKDSLFVQRPVWISPNPW